MITKPTTPKASTKRFWRNFDFANLFFKIVGEVFVFESPAIEQNYKAQQQLKTNLSVFQKEQTNWKLFLFFFCFWRANLFFTRQRIKHTTQQKTTKPTKHVNNRSKNLHYRPRKQKTRKKATNENFSSLKFYHEKKKH